MRTVQDLIALLDAHSGTGNVDQSELPHVDENEAQELPYVDGEDDRGDGGQKGGHSRPCEQDGRGCSESQGGASKADS